MWLMHIISALGGLRDGNYHKFKASLDYRMNLFQKERRGKRRKGGKEVGREGKGKGKEKECVWYDYLETLDVTESFAVSG